MKITIFNGSPRGKNGNTHVMVKAFSEGLKKSKAEVTNVFLAEKKIGHCLGCFSCWVTTPGQCVIKDDMSELIGLISSSDVIVLATPLYVDNVTGIMKNFLDRLIPMADPKFLPDEHGESRHLPRCKHSIDLIVMSNCGFPEQSHFEILRHYFRRMARNANMKLIAEIYRGEGELLRDPPLLLIPAVWKYKRLLKSAAVEIVELRELSDETKAKLEKPLVSYERYTKGANKMWDDRLKRVK